MQKPPQFIIWENTEHTRANIDYIDEKPSIYYSTLNYAEYTIIKWI